MATSTPNNTIYYHYIITVVLVILAAGGGYVVGIRQVKTATAASSALSLGSGQSGAGNVPGSSNGLGRFRGGGGGAGGGQGGGVSGQVSAVSGNTVTVIGRDGSSSTVNLSSDTVISKTVTGSPNDIAVGQTLLIRGTDNGDGSLQAQTIQIRPSAAASSNPAAGAL